MSRPDSTPAGGVQRLDPVESVRKHPEWYFHSGHFNTPELIARLTEEAFAHGSTHVTIRRWGEWFALASSEDWLSGDRSVFFAPNSDPVAGPNASRVEVLLTAFCRRVLTAGFGEPFDVFGTGAPPKGAAELLADTHLGRVLVFLVPDDGAPPTPAPSTSVHDAGRKLVLVNEENLGVLLDDAIRRYADKLRELRGEGEQQ